MAVIVLDIPRLGGIQDFKVLKCASQRKYRYVCSTWEGDGLDNPGNYDIMRDNDTMEYYALPV